MKDEGKVKTDEYPYARCSEYFFKQNPLLIRLERQLTHAMLSLDDRACRRRRWLLGPVQRITEVVKNLFRPGGRARQLKRAVYPGGSIPAEVSAVVDQCAPGKPAILEEFAVHQDRGPFLGNPSDRFHVDLPLSSVSVSTDAFSELIPIRDGCWNSFGEFEPGLPVNVKR